MGESPRRCLWSVAAACAVVIVTLPRARAADTVEPFDAGAGDVDLHFGLDRVGQRRGQEALQSDVMFGYGLAPRLSAAVGTSLEAADTFERGAAALYLVVFGTPLDTDHVDLDLLLTGSAGGPGMHELELAPGLELNLDAAPDMSSWGVYLRGAVPVAAAPRSSQPSEDQPARRLSPRPELCLELTLGAYYTMARRHQVLLEHDVTYRPRPADGERSTEIGGAALGYNVALTDAIELISEVYLDVPQRGERPAVRLTAGLILTLPELDTQARDSSAAHARQRGSIGAGSSRFLER